MKATFYKNKEHFKKHVHVLSLYLISQGDGWDYEEDDADFVPYVPPPSVCPALD